MSFPSWPPKDTNEVLDYDIDWTDRLASDTISTSTWSIVSGTVSIQTDSKTSTRTKVWLTGGTTGGANVLLNRVVTVGGRTMDQSVKLKIKDK